MRILAGEVEKLAQRLTHWHTMLKNWHAFGTLAHLLFYKNEKLRRPRWHVDHSGMHSTLAVQLMKYHKWV